MIQRSLLLATVVAGLGLAVPAAAQVDGEAVFKENDCHKCHHATKAKKGPSLAKIAAKYKDKKLDEKDAVKHMTTAQKVKLDDGVEEDHKVIDSKDPNVLSAVAQWMLTR